MKNLLLACVFLLTLAAVTVADEHSGPGRRTIVREGWGTVFFAPKQVKGDYEFSMNEDGDRYVFTTEQGEVVITEDAEDITLTYPDFSAAVDFEPEFLQITWGEAIHRFQREGSTMTYSGPQGEVVFTRGPKELTITGPRGDVALRDLEGEYTVESAAGKTRFETLPSGFRVSGVRLTEHPYLRRGALFSHKGVGIYVELALLDPKNPLFRLLEWDTLIELESTGE
jgi:hypothetical protein